MQNVIAVIAALLGTVLVLSGAGALWGAAQARSRSGEDSRSTAETSTTDSDRMRRTLATLGRMDSPERLIAWGVVLLLISVVAGGAITFGITLTAGSH